MECLKSKMLPNEHSVPTTMYYFYFFHAKTLICHIKEVCFVSTLHNAHVYWLHYDLHMMERVIINCFE